MTVIQRFPKAALAETKKTSNAKNAKKKKSREESNLSFILVSFASCVEILRQFVNDQLIRNYGGRHESG